MPTAKLTVHAVRPVGTNFIWTNSLGTPAELPIWECAITNTGRASAHWLAYLHFKDSEHEWANLPGWRSNPETARFSAAEGLIPAGQSAIFEVPVPPDPSTNWAVTVRYFTSKGQVEQRLQAWLAPIPKLRNLLPNSGDHFASDVWHTGTNVTTVH
jgi:hypothetical protein